MWVLRAFRTPVVCLALLSAAALACSHLSPRSWEPQYRGQIWGVYLAGGRLRIDNEPQLRDEEAVGAYLEHRLQNLGTRRKAAIADFRAARARDPRGPHTQPTDNPAFRASRLTAELYTRWSSAAPRTPRVEPVAVRLDYAAAALAAPFVAWPAYAIWQRRRRRSRIARNVCPDCRYNMRATPGRCPECGWASPTPSPD